MILLFLHGESGLKTKVREKFHNLWQFTSYGLCGQTENRVLEPSAPSFFMLDFAPIAAQMEHMLDNASRLQWPLHTALRQLRLFAPKATRPTR
jgi:hypothetical protein